MLIGADMGLAAAVGAAAFAAGAALTGSGGRSAFVTATLSLATGMACFSLALAVNVIPTRRSMATTPMARFIGTPLGRCCGPGPVDAAPPFAVEGPHDLPR